ncbi:MAG: hypothetical protein ACXACY_17575 [Candidatus Hodarchaeales archaeon]
MMTKQSSDIDLELYELVFPGQLIGKAVIDSDARMVGVIRNVRIQVPSSTESIQAIGNVIQLNIDIKHSEPIEVTDVIRLRNEIQEEITHFFQVLQSR